jgi:hypothetical protein
MQAYWVWRGVGGALMFLTTWYLPECLVHELWSVGQGHAIRPLHAAEDAT